MKNIYQNGVLFHLNNCAVEVANTIFDNIHECYQYNNCNSDSDIPEEKFESALFHQTGSVNLKMLNSTFNHIYGEYRTKVTRGSTTTYNCEFINSYFKNGFIYYPDTTDKFISATYWFEDMLFKNNTSIKGTFLHISDVKTKVNLFGTFIRAKFINNTATNFGGVIFSEAGRNVTINSIDFKECSFEKNNAERGKISYIYDNNHDVNYKTENKSKLNNLKKDSNNFVTNPTHLLFDNYDNSTLVINSGDRIGQYSCTLYDDYGNKFNQSTDISDYTLDELIFYELSLEGIENREQHSIIYGSNSGYCLNNSCKFKNIRLVGTPGNYLLKIRIVGFGHYSEFFNNEASLNIKIKECDEKIYNYQDKDGGNIKSCYIPVCDPPCENEGVCINDNTCECKKHFTGKICTERFHMEKNTALYIIILIIGYFFSIITLLMIPTIIYFRNHSVIKAASYDFLIIILIGLLLNFIHSILEVKEITSDLFCMNLIFIENLGFTLTYGSIISKTIRVYHVFTQKAVIQRKDFSKYILSPMSR